MTELARSTRRDAPAPTTVDALSEGERIVLAALREIAYGEVEVVVHGSRIVQVTRSQKLRVDGR